jgi:hypothetical protein
MQLRYAWRDENESKLLSCFSLAQSVASPFSRERVKVKVASRRLLMPETPHLNPLPSHEGRGGSTIVGFSA